MDGKINFPCFNGGQPSAKEGRKKGEGGKEKGKNREASVSKPSRLICASPFLVYLASPAPSLHPTLLAFCSCMLWSAHSASLSAEPSPFPLLSITVL